MVKLNDILKDDTYIIFYREGCPYCIKALKLLQNHKFKKINIEKLTINKKKGTKDSLLEFLNKKNLIDKNHTTVPIIFYGKKFIGGCAELENYLSNI